VVSSAIQVTFSSTTASRTVDFTCASCGHRARATAHGIGEGTATILNIDPDDVSASRARRDAEADAQRTIRIVPCPRCGVRDRGAVLAWWALHVGPLLLLFAGIALAGWAPLLFDLNMHEKDKWLAGWIMTGIAILVSPLAASCPSGVQPKRA
jgi:hypothetical protein